PEADRDGERADLLGLLQLLAELDARQRVAHGDAHADQLLQLIAETLEVGGPARDHDLADAQRAGLVLVELERGDELPREALQLAANGFPRGRGLFRGEPFRHVVDGERELALERLGLRRRRVELAGNRDVESSSAPVQNARELADAPVRDGKGRAVVAERNDDDGGGGGGSLVLGRRGGRAQTCEGLEVDSCEADAGLLAG